MCQNLTLLTVHQWNYLNLKSYKKKYFYYIVVQILGNAVVYGKMFQESIILKS